MTENEIRAALAPFNLGKMLDGVHAQSGLVHVTLAVKREDAAELEPLRRLLEGVPPMDVHGGPVILGFTALIDGGDGKDQPMGEDYHNPIPAEWQAAARAVTDPPLPFSSDAFIDLIWPDSS